MVKTKSKGGFMPRKKAASKRVKIKKPALKSPTMRTAASEDVDAALDFLVKKSAGLNLTKDKKLAPAKTGRSKAEKRRQHKVKVKAGLKKQRNKAAKVSKR
jgi:hypothetical protein